MRAILIVAAASLGALAVPASAAYTVTINNVLAQGTRTVEQSSYSCLFSCPVTRTVFETAVTGTALANGDGPLQDLLFTGQDRARSYYTVDLEYNDRGELSGTSLSGVVDFRAPCTTAPNCTIDTAMFNARNFQVTLTDTVSGISTILAPVPEPSTWTMMLLGLGAIGYSMRRRRRPSMPFQAA
jgi:hypothetical protein